MSRAAQPRAAPTESRFARLHPKAFLGAYGVAGLLVAAFCAWAFLAIADEIGERAWLVHLDVAVTNWLHAHGTPGGETFFIAVSKLGSPVLALLLVAAAVLLLVRRDWRHVTTLAVTWGGGALLNNVLKLAYHRPRPPFAKAFDLTSWSFPSGHAMDSLIGYGLLAYWIARHFPRYRVPTIGMAALLVLAIGYSRIYLGVHYLSDVVGGFCAGLIWLYVCATGYRFAEHRRVGAAGVDESA